MFRTWAVPIACAVVACGGSVDTGSGGSGGGTSTGGSGGGTSTGGSGGGTSTGGSGGGTSTGGSGGGTSTGGSGGAGGGTTCNSLATCCAATCDLVAKLGCSGGSECKCNVSGVSPTCQTALEHVYRCAAEHGLAALKCDVNGKVAPACGPCDGPLSAASSVCPGTDLKCAF